MMSPSPARTILSFGAIHRGRLTARSRGRWCILRAAASPPPCEAVAQSVRNVDSRGIAEVCAFGEVARPELAAKPPFETADAQPADGLARRCLVPDIALDRVAFGTGIAAASVAGEQRANRVGLAAIDGHGRGVPPWWLRLSIARHCPSEAATRVSRPVRGMGALGRGQRMGGALRLLPGWL